MTDYRKYSFDDFINDSDFVQMVLRNERELDKLLAKIGEEDAELEKIAGDAAKLIRLFQIKESVVPVDRLQMMKKRIDKNLQPAPKIKLQYWKHYAAAVVLLLVVSTLVIRINSFKPIEFSNEVADLNTTRVVLSDGKEEAVLGKESEIRIQKGSVVINRDTVKIQPPKESKKESRKLNEVIVPFGKRTRLSLPDGSIIHLNAGSKLSFPDKFDPGKREVNLIGEALFKVESDKSRPFIVHTPEMDVRVTGTTFNVTAYDEDEYTQAVLVEGKVAVQSRELFGAKKILKPGEKASLENGSGEIGINKVNTRFYTSWVDGYVICESESIGSIIKRLEKYYHQNIRCADEIRDETFSGKLDLKEDVFSVLENIALTSGFSLETNNNQIILKTRMPMN